jgi:hypothetical protein
MKFGKHSGKPLTEVPTPYLQWLSGDNEDGTPRCTSKWFSDQVNSEIARRTGAGADEPVSDGHGYRPVSEAHRPVETHRDAPPGSQAWISQSKASLDQQRLFTALATINSKLNDILVRLGEPVAVADGEDIAF